MEKNVFERIYDVVERVPCGKVATYGQIAALVGNPRLARVVGYALHVNPRPGIIPCHRIVTRLGLPASGFAFGGPNCQLQMLASEGVFPEKDGHIDLQKHGWNGKDESNGNFTRNISHH